VPGASAGRAASWLGRHWPRWPWLPRALRLGTTLENVGDHAETAYYNDLCFLKPREARALLGIPPGRPVESPVYEAVTAPYRRCQSKSVVQRAQYADLKIYLSNDVLVKVDRMSMRHSLEVRCPLLDRRVVEFAFRIPTQGKMPGLRPKHLLRSMARDRLPAEVIGLPKHGFTAPVQQWLAGPYGRRFTSEVLTPNSWVGGLLDIQRVRRSFDEHRTGVRDNSYALWAIWCLERWHSLRSDRIAQSRPERAAV
jgi:asparagine synthase (glutamine-hydrolysing)